MPIYEYECQKCNKITEELQSMSEDPLTTCSACNGELKKLISNSSFQLKGGGWYADGYSSVKAEPKSTPKSDAKPAASSSSKSKSSGCAKAASCPCAS